MRPCRSAEAQRFGVWGGVFLTQRRRSAEVLVLFGVLSGKYGVGGAR